MTTWPSRFISRSCWRGSAHISGAGHPEPAQPSVVQVGDLTIDPRARQVRRGDRPVELTAREFELLDLLAREAGHVLSKDVILERLWGYAFDDNLVEVYVGYLRRKLGEPALIHTIRGAGYVLRRRGLMAARDAVPPRTEPHP